MKNILNKIKIKKSLGLKIKKVNNSFIVENNTSIRQKMIFLKPIFTGNNSFFINTNIETISGEDCEVKLINRKLRVIEHIAPKIHTYLDKVPKVVFIGISFEPNSKYEIKSIEYSIGYNPDKEINNYFKNNILVLCPGYPSDNDKYACGFIHSRVKEYAKHNIKVDVACVNELYIEKTEFYSFEGQKICRLGFNELRMLLLNKHYDKILIHFLNPSFLKIIDAVNIKDTQLLLYTHGVDTLYHVYEKIGAPYFKKDYDIPKNMIDSFSERDHQIKKFNERENCKFIFASKWNKELSEKLLDIKYNNYDIVPCYVDDSLFTYEKKDPEKRKKIFILRPQNNLKSYSMDINVRVILELSHRKCFNDMEFDIYGTGSEHDKLMEPLRRFSNVHIYNKFLSHEEIAVMHKDHGIALFASRFDTQGVSACEAAMSGNIVISSKGVGTEEFIDSKFGTYCDTENFKEYADLIEKIYNNPSLFNDLSYKMHESVMKTCSYEVSLKRDMEVIKSFNKVEKINIPSLKKNPLLSISIASYNISSFVIQILCSLLRSKYASELEILVINDGSKDDTVKKVNDFIKANYKGKEQPVIRVVDKENGGHGSTLNKGIELATGKYFKLLDGDDYYNTSELDKLMEILKTNKSDLVLTNYVSDFSVYGVSEVTKYYDALVPGVEYYLEDVTNDGYGFSEWGPLLHTSTYKTELLKNANFKIDEHCFYVDMEYNFIGMIQAKTMIYYPFNIYYYYIGRSGQSVSPESYKKNVFQHERVCMRIIKEYYDRIDSIPYGKQHYIMNKMIVPLCKMQYEITTSYFKKNDKFLSFEKKLKQYPEIYNNKLIVGRRIKFNRLTKGLLLPLYNILIKIKK